MKEMRIEETANRVTEAFKKASENTKKTVDALMTDDAKKKLDVLEALEANEKNDDLRDKKSENVKVPTPHEKAAEKLKQAARELFADMNVTEQMPDVTVPLPKSIRSRAEDMQILRAELEDARHDLNEADTEIVELRKTISKMKQQHEAEVQDLKDQLGEAKAAEAAAKKAHAHAVGEKNNYADALDNDSVAFEEILGLAILLERGAKSMHEVSRMIQAKTEGRV